jgi:hypothetical protein
MYVALVFTDMLKGIHKCIIDLLGAIVRSRLVMEVNNIQSKEFLVYRPLMLWLCG